MLDKAKIIILFIFFSINIYSQELGIAPLKIWTNNYEIKDPIGFSIYAFQPIWKFGIKIEYTFANNSRQYYGFIVNGFLSLNELTRENVASKSKYQSLEIGLMVPNIVSYSGFGFNAGLGVSFDAFLLERNGQITGKYVDFGKDKKYGIFYTLAISKEHFLELPMKVELLFKSKGLASTMHATDSEEPFGLIKSIEALQLNISFLF